MAVGTFGRGIYILDDYTPLRHATPELLARPAGVALIITGTVLLVAVSISLPFLNVKLVGLIVIVAGLVKARALQRASSWLWRNVIDGLAELLLRPASMGAANSWHRPKRWSASPHEPARFSRPRMGCWLDSAEIG